MLWLGRGKKHHSAILRFVRMKKSIAAGALIGLGCAANLHCTSKAAGAALFAVGLILICLLDLDLFTGKIGYIRNIRPKTNLIKIWLGNLAGILAVTVLVRLGRPEIHTASVALVAKKFDLPLWRASILACLCGMVMCLAVEAYRRHKNSMAGVVAVWLCVITFVMCGFEHSIANMGYCVLAANTASDLVMAVRLILITTTCNGVGAIAMNFLIGRKDAKT